MESSSSWRKSAEHDHENSLIEFTFTRSTYVYSFRTCERLAKGSGYTLCFHQDVSSECLMETSEISEPLFWFVMRIAVATNGASKDSCASMTSG